MVKFVFAIVAGPKFAEDFDQKKWRKEKRKGAGGLVCNGEILITPSKC